MNIFSEIYSKRNVMFVFLTLCLTFLAFLTLSLEQPVILEAAILLLGICASMICITKRFVSKQQTPDSQKIKRVFFSLLLFAAAFLAIFWFVCLNHQKYTNTIILAAKICCILLFGLGIYGLFKGFQNNGQWLSIYIFSIMLLFLFSICFSIACDMSPTDNTEHYRFYATVGVLGGVIGLWSAKWCCS